MVMLIVSGMNVQLERLQLVVDIPAASSIRLDASLHF